jgi:hypothetical protein
VASRLLGVPRARDQRRTEDKGRIAPQMHDYSHKSPNTRSTKYSSSHLVSLRFRQAKGINLTSFFLRSPQISRPLPVNEVGRCSSEDRQIEGSPPSSSQLQSRTPTKIAVPLHKTAAQGIVVEGCVGGVGGTVEHGVVGRIVGGVERGIRQLVWRRRQAWTMPTDLQQRCSSTGARHLESEGEPTSEVFERLAALVLKSKKNLISPHGCLAPSADE